MLYSKEDYERLRQAFQQKRIDSGIIVGTEMAAEVYGDILSRGCPLAIIDLDPEEAKKLHGGQASLTLVNSMDYEGAYMAVEYLIEMGHTGDRPAGRPHEHVFRPGALPGLYGRDAQPTGCPCATSSC